MAVLILFFFVILYTEVILEHTSHKMKKSSEQPLIDYFNQRKQLIKNENDLSVGGKLQLSPIEAMANEVLITAKDREMHNGLNLLLTIVNLRDISTTGLRGQVRDCSN